MVKTYSFDEAYSATIDYFYGDTLAANVWCDKYALRDSDGNFLEKTPHDMHDRLAKEFARIDSKYGLDYDSRFFVYRQAMDKFSRIVPQGSPMSAVGNTEQIMSASNCVVVESPYDSIAGIMKTGAELAQLYKRRCGTGLDISTLRPDGFPVNNAARTTSGAWSFADYYSYITRMIGQCLHESTEILTKNGLIKINSIKEGDEVWTAKGWVPVIGVLTNKKECVKVTTYYGHEVICSKDHMFHTIMGEKPIKDMLVGDPITQIVGEIPWTGKEVVLKNPAYIKHPYNNSNRLNETITIPSKLDTKFSYILGQMYGDGCVVTSKSQDIKETGIQISLSPGWAGIKTKLQKYVKEVFNYDGTIHKGDGCDVLYIYSKILTQFLKENNLLKQKAHELVFPRKMLEADSSIVCSFIAGFLDADGDIQVSKKSYRIRSTSKEMSLYIHTILFSLGVPCRLVKLVRNNVKGQENWKDMYCLTISGMKAQHKFYELMVESVKVRSYSFFIKKQDKLRTCYKTSDFNTRASKHSYIIDDAQWITFSTSDRLKLDTMASLDVRLLQDYISEIEVYDNSSEQVVYDLILSEEHLFFANGLYAHNSGRRGALMITLGVHHPDVELFASMKADLTKVTGSNISIRLSDEFLNAVDKNLMYEQRWPEENPTFTRMVSARQVWKIIIDNATANAEPGLIFWDRLTKRLPAHSYKQFKTCSTNPCSEIGLSAYDSCRLISLNLTGYVKYPFTNKASFDFEMYEPDVRTAVQMIDNLVDIELELIERIQAACTDQSEKDIWQKLCQSGHDGRRVGLGTHGLADMLAQLNIKYDSQEALEFANKLATVHRDTAYEASIDLAEQRGAFPAFDWSTEKDNEYIKDLPEALRSRMSKVGRRNISMLTQAPTGSVSLLSKCGQFNRYNTSSGIEPVFRNSYTRRKKINDNDGNTRVDFIDGTGDKWQNFEIYHGNILNYVEFVGVQSVSDVKIPDFFVTSDQIDWKYRVKLQGILQSKIDHSISSSLNLPRGTSSDVVSDIYLSSWKEGLKGVTVYVDGSRSGVLVPKDKDMVDPTIRPEKVIRMMAPKRPESLPCEIHQHAIKGDRWTAIVGLLHGEPYEMFGGYSDVISVPKKYRTGKLVKRSRGKYSLYLGEGDDELIIKDVLGTFNNPELAYVTRLVSTALRHGTPIEFLVDQLSREGTINSFNKVLARVLKKYIPDGESVKSGEHCEKCGGANLVWQEGCKSCKDCANTKCSS